MDKYQSTEHISYSESVHNDDSTINKIIENKILNNKIVITVKLDGGNTCLSVKDGVFARSHSTTTFCPTFDYIKNIHYYSKLHLLNPRYKYFGENMYAIHSIEYNALTDFFYLFHILDLETDTFLSFEDMLREAERCEFQVVPHIYIGNDKTSKEIEELIFKNMKVKFLGSFPEGFVIRNSESFLRNEFGINMMKFVRKDHVQTNEHWSRNWKSAKKIN